MPTLNAADLAQVRSRPIGRKFSLYVYQPVTVWVGQVGGSPSQGDTELTVTTVSGDPNDVLADMTCRVTNAAGQSKIWPSKVRVKSHNGGSPGVLTVAENNIDWLAAPGDRVSVVRLWELWPRIPYITPDGIQWKDRTVAWSNDNQAQPPKANAGPAVVATLGSGGTVDVVFKNQGSFVCPSGGNPTSYRWTALGGSPAVVAGAEASSTVTYQYNTAGYYYVRLRARETIAGNDFDGYRYVPVVIDDGTLRARYEIPGDRYWDQNGWKLSERVLSVASESDDDDWYDGAPIFLVADDSQVAESAFYDNRANLRWSGWLIEDTAQRDRGDREVRFDAVSTAHVLRNVPAFPVGLRSSASPSNWYEFTDLSIDSVAYLLLRWHSTLDVVADYVPIGEWTARPRPGENCGAEDLLSQVNAVLRACHADIRCDRQGNVRAMRNEWFLSAAEEAARSTVMTLQVGDFSRAQYGPDQHRAQVREVRASGVDGSSNPYIAGSPGRSPLDGGRPVEIQRLAPTSQSELNQWAGQQLGYENEKGVVRLRMSGEFDCVDPAWGEYVAGSLSGFDPRIPDGPYSVVGVRFRFDPLLKYCLSEWELLPRPGMHDADAIEIPPESPPPEPPPPPLPTPEDPEPLATGEVVIVGTVGAGVCVTFDAISGVPPTWYELNDRCSGSVIDTIDTSFIDDLVLNPAAPSFQAACIDGNGDVHINNDWRNFDCWYETLTPADCTTLSGQPSPTILQLSVAPDGTLVAVVNFDYGAVEAISLFVSTNWGDPTKILSERWEWKRIPQAWAGSAQAASCSYSVQSNWYDFDAKSNPLTGGDVHLVEVGGKIACWVMAFCWVASTGRANMAYNADIVNSDDWAVAYRIPSGSSCLSGNGWLGGRRSDGFHQWNGPLGSCVNRDDDYIYMASFQQHESTGSNRAMARIKKDATVDLDDTYIDTDIDVGFAERKGMLIAPAEGSGRQFIALELDEDPPASTEYYTNIYVDVATNSSYNKRIPEAWRVGYAFPILVDQGQNGGPFHILYLGRSYDSAAGERADSDQQQCFLVCKRNPAAGTIASAFDDKTGNLFDLGARGITAIQADTESD